nr:T7SS effector LXG polymorphic toxin [Bacillus sp. J37]
MDDIISLEAFSTDDFNTAMDDAKKKRENTIKDVDALDQQLLEEYKVSESAEFHIANFYKQQHKATQFIQSTLMLKHIKRVKPINFQMRSSNTPMITSHLKRNRKKLEKN